MMTNKSILLVKSEFTSSSNKCDWKNEYKYSLEWNVLEKLPISRLSCETKDIMEVYNKEMKDFTISTQHKMEFIHDGMLVMFSK